MRSSIKNELDAVISSVNNAYNEWEFRLVHGGLAEESSYPGEDEEVVNSYIRRAYCTLISFLEINGINSLREELQNKWKTHKNNLLDDYISSCSQEPTLSVMDILYDIITSVQTLIDANNIQDNPKNNPSVVRIENIINVHTHKMDFDDLKEILEIVKNEIERFGDEHKKSKANEHISIIDKEIKEPNKNKSKIRDAFDCCIRNIVEGAAGS